MYCSINTKNSYKSGATDMNIRLSRRLFCTLLTLLCISPTLSGYAIEPEVLREMEQEVVEKICSDGGIWLKCYNLEAGSCNRVASSFVPKCLERTLAGISQPIAENQQSPLSLEILDCFNEEFTQRYGMDHLGTPECEETPEHLR